MPKSIPSTNLVNKSPVDGRASIVPMAISAPIDARDVAAVAREGEMEIRGPGRTEQAIDDRLDVLALRDIGVLHHSLLVERPESSRVRRPARIERWSDGAMERWKVAIVLVPLASACG